MKLNLLYSRVRRRVRGRLLSLLVLLQNEDVDKIEQALIAEGMRTLVGSYTDKIPDKAYDMVAKEVRSNINLAPSGTVAVKATSLIVTLLPVLLVNVWVIILDVPATDREPELNVSNTGVSNV